MIVDEEQDDLPVRIRTTNMYSSNSFASSLGGDCSVLYLHAFGSQLQNGISWIQLWRLGTNLSLIALNSNFDALTRVPSGSLDSGAVCSSVSNRLRLPGTLATALLIATNTFCKSWIEIGCVEGFKNGLLGGVWVWAWDRQESAGASMLAVI